MVTVRLTTAADAESIGRVHAETWRAAYAGVIPEAMLWVLEGNDRAERFYRAAGWSRDGGRKEEEFQGAEISEVRYRKRL